MMGQWLRFIGRLLGGVAAVLPGAAVHAVVYSQDMDKAAWQVDASIFECRLSQDIPYYGRAAFLRRAGESAAFELSAQTERMQAGQAQVRAMPPLWKPGASPRELGPVTVASGAQPLVVGARLTEQMLAELHRGMDVVVTRRPWYGPEAAGSLHMGISAVNFRPAYRQYLDCLGALLPVNYTQVQRQSIYFTSAGDELRPSELKKLENLILYIKADPVETRFFVDGHTDSAGERADNLELSRRRAEQIKTYLEQNGIAPDQITTRWHGERYPVLANTTRERRAQNRRVTIRLERGEAAAAVPDESDDSPPQG